MLEIQNIAWSPEGEGVIHDISLHVDSGKMIVVTGPNGGGKTSLAKLIAGINRPTSGKIIFNGEDITELDITERAKRGIAYAFQQPVRFKGLSVQDLLDTAAGKALNVQETCKLLEAVGLCANDYKDRELNASLSGGKLKE